MRLSVLVIAITGKCGKWAMIVEKPKIIICTQYNTNPIAKITQKHSLKTQKLTQNNSRMGVQLQI